MNYTQDDTYFQSYHFTYLHFSLFRFDISVFSCCLLTWLWSCYCWTAVCWQSFSFCPSSTSATFILLIPILFRLVLKFFNSLRSLPNEISLMNQKKCHLLHCCLVQMAHHLLHLQHQPWNQAFVTKYQSTMSVQYLPQVKQIRFMWSDKTWRVTQGHSTVTHQCTKLNSHSSYLIIRNTSLFIVIVIQTITLTTCFPFLDHLLHRH